MKIQKVKPILLLVTFLYVGDVIATDTASKNNLYLETRTSNPTYWIYGFYLYDSSSYYTANTSFESGQTYSKGGYADWGTNNGAMAFYFNRSGSASTYNWMHSYTTTNSAESIVSYANSLDNFMTDNYNNDYEYNESDANFAIVGNLSFGYKGSTYTCNGVALMQFGADISGNTWVMLGNNNDGSYAANMGWLYNPSTVEELCEYPGESSTQQANVSITASAFYDDTFYINSVTSVESGS